MAKKHIGRLIFFRARFSAIYTLFCLCETFTGGLQIQLYWDRCSCNPTYIGCGWRRRSSFLTSIKPFYSSCLDIPNTVLLASFKMKPKFSLTDQWKMNGGGKSVRDHSRHCNFVFLTAIQILTKFPFLLGLLQSLPPLSTSPQPHQLANPYYLFFMLYSILHLQCRCLHPSTEYQWPW